MLISIGMTRGLRGQIPLREIVAFFRKFVVSKYLVNI
jgi:hypothetical protein